MFHSKIKKITIKKKNQMDEINTIVENNFDDKEAALDNQEFWYFGVIVIFFDEQKFKFRLLV